MSEIWYNNSRKCKGDYSCYESGRIYKEFRKYIESLQKQVNNLTEMVKLLTKKQFGSLSEKTKHKIDGQMTLFNEAEIEANEDELDPTKTTVKNYTRRIKGQKEKLLKDIHVEIVEYKLNGEALLCPWCNTPIRLIGKETVREELEFIPAKVKVKQYRRYSYECPQCLKDGTPTIEKAVPLYRLLALNKNNKILV